MKLFITKYLGGQDHEVTLMGNKECKTAKINLIVGCAINIPGNYTEKEFDNVMNGLVGTIISVSDDCHQDKFGYFLPGEKDMI